jgi:hypothetical protein
MLGYSEVIESLRWGLSELGHEVTVAINAAAKDRTNIIFGGQILTEQHFHQFRADTVFYNFEQIGGVPLHSLKQSIYCIAARFQVWDYSPQNMDTWRQLNLAFAPVLVPVGFSPTLQRIPKRGVEDIDVLFYGHPSESRMRVLSEICETGAKYVFACGLYGQARDELISRAKIVLNVTGYALRRIFEVARVSYLLANEKAVVSDIYPDSLIEADLKEAVAYAPLEEISQTCAKLLENEADRRQLEERGAAIFRRRDIREILRNALAAMK